MEDENKSLDKSDEKDDTVANTHFGKEESGDTDDLVTDADALLGELDAFEEGTVAEQEEQSQTPPTISELPDPTPPAVEATKPETDERKLSSDNVAIKKSVAASQASDALASIQTNMREYIRRMQPGMRQDIESIKANQRIMYSILVSAFTRENVREAGNLVYHFFRTEPALGQRFVMRGLREMATTDRKVAFTLRSIIGIILRTLDGSKREEQLQHIDLTPLLKEIPNEDVRNGVMEYLRLK